MCLALAGSRRPLLSDNGPAAQLATRERLMMVNALS